MEFNKKLKDLRLKLGKTQKEMAQYMEIEEPQYRRYELGLMVPKITKIEILKNNIPSVDLNYLLNPNE